MKKTQNKNQQDNQAKITSKKPSIQCEINGAKIMVPEGTSVIEAFKNQNFDICHYCYHSGLSVAGVCRLCMVDIQGINKLQIACNTQIKDGMIINNTSKKVQESVRWGMEYHLINHPLDCPICDQAGECALQNQYMKFGPYDSSMAEPKVKKRKLVDLGSKIVLDTERCILCSRCVRFTSEITKTHELGIFNRGDRSEIGVFKNKSLDNDYAGNTVDICPVGALTSKDFRFKQRVWYLQTEKSICTGCSTGCNIFVDYNEEGLWRVRPRFNKNVNSHWMCDKGRNIYSNSNPYKRLTTSLQAKNLAWQAITSQQALLHLKNQIKNQNPCFVLTGQYTNEEYESLAKFFPKSMFYHWINNEKTFKDFDNMLLRGDKNPNTQGLKQAFPKIKSIKDLKEDIKNIKLLWVLGPENPEFFPNMKSITELCMQSEQLVWMSLIQNPYLDVTKTIYHIPMKSFFEKNGTYTNYKSLKQNIKKIQILQSQARSIQDIVSYLEKDFVNTESKTVYFKKNQFLNNKTKLW